MAKRRVVITGMGMVSPLGLTVPQTWDNILAGKSGVQTVEEFDLTNFPTRIAASVKAFDPSAVIPIKDLKKMDLFIQYAIYAAREAITDAGLVVTEDNAERVGVAIGSGIGGLPVIESSHKLLLKTGPRRISPFFVPAVIINMASGNVSIQNNFKGPNFAIVSACTTGTHNIGFAARTIAYGDADVMIAGGSENATCPMGLAGFAAARALSKRNDEPEGASRPWDEDRDGFVLGDGAGVLILEEYEYAKRRGAKIYAELLGFGMSSDAYHMTSPDTDGNGAMRSMQNALNDAAIDPATIDYINAHATSTVAGDAVEILAIKKTFQDHAQKLAVSSTKSMIGHLLGAAGAVEAIFSVLAIRDQVAPPTINLDNPSEGCDLNLVPHQAQDMSITTTLSNSFGFGGTNASLIFRAIE